jgi:DNA polymerase elongation subunit (family B)
LDGWLLDVYPDHESDRMVFWVLSDGGGAHGFRHVYWPTFYVAGGPEDLQKVSDMFSQLSSVRSVRTVVRLADITDRAPRELLEVEIGRYSEAMRLAGAIERMGGFHDLALFNVDLRLPSRFMAEHGVFPIARVRVDPSKGELEALDGRFDLDYPLPPLRKVHLDISVEASKGIPTLGDRLVSVTLTPCDGVDENGRPDGPGEAWTLDGPEETLLRDLMGAVKRLDPDVVFTPNGDSFAFPFLYHCAGRAGLGAAFTLGREPPHKDAGPERPAKRDKSYFSYGRVVYKPAAHLLRGRWHIDGSGFHMRQSGLSGLMDLSRISCVPVQELSRLSPGTAISTMQVLEALRSGRLVAWKKNIPELFKTARGLMAADRGGLVLEPRVGVHDCVAEVDFASLYPNIMVMHNISPETLLCDCCGPGTDGGAGAQDIVPEAGYHFCKRHEGLVPRVLRPVLARRFEYKRRAKQKDLPEKERAACKEMNDILKWLLVVCFGYTGYRNARFGRIECHEAITSYAREILTHAANVAESLGFRVLHGIVDSLWVQGRGDLDKLCEAISEAIGIAIVLEGSYRWIVFLPNKTNGAGALNRYYGCFDTGEVKVRGIELRRTDTPQYFRKVQEAMLKVLAEGEDAQGFLRKVPAAVDVLKGFAKDVLSGSIDPRELVFTHRVSQSLAEYRHLTDHVAALKQLDARGFSVQPGQNVRFVITNGASGDWRDKVAVAEFIDGGTAYDRGKYLEHLCRCGESMLLPFGYTLERLLDIVGGRGGGARTPSKAISRIGPFENNII